jgi:hypothetical protein
MRAAAAGGPIRGQGSAARTNAAGVAAIMTLSVAMMVIAFGVVATSGVYSSRLAWLLDCALPLLALTMLLSGLSLPGRTLAYHATGPAQRSRREKIARGVFLTALSLFGVPLALVTMLLAAYALVFAVHGVSLLL